MITDYNRLSGLHKVAILFSVLGESLAMSLIKGLSRTEVRKIRATIREMDSVSFTLKRRIMEEFYFGFLSEQFSDCLLYTSPSPRDAHESRMPSSA